MPGKMVEIDTADTDETAFVVPNNRLFNITRIQVNNRATTDVRVRGWDTFTDTDGTVHSTSASPVPLFDYPVAAGDGIVVDCGIKAKRVMGTLKLQAAGAGIGASTPVEVYVGGEYEV